MKSPLDDPLTLTQELLARLTAAARKTLPKPAVAAKKRRRRRKALAIPLLLALAAFADSTAHPCDADAYIDPPAVVGK